MTLYQTPTVALGTLLCGSAQNIRIPAISTLTVRQAEASHKRQLVQVDYHDLRDWTEGKALRTSASISTGMHP